MKNAMQGVKEHGYDSFDVSPFWGNTEKWMGEILSQIESEKERNLYKIITKWVPPPTMEDITMASVEHSIDQSLKRLGKDTLDLVQLHWWDPNDIRYLDVGYYLTRLQEKGKIKHIGTTK